MPPSNEEILAEIRTIKDGQARLEKLITAGDPNEDRPSVLERIRRLEWFRRVFLAALAAIAGPVAVLVINALWGLVAK